MEFSHNPQDWWRKKQIHHHLHTIPAFLNLSLYPKADCQSEVQCQQNSALQLFVCNPISSKSWKHTFSLSCSCILSGIFPNNRNHSLFFFFPRIQRCDWEDVIISTQDRHWKLISHDTYFPNEHVSKTMFSILQDSAKHFNTLIAISSFW